MVLTGIVRGLSFIKAPPAAKILTPGDRQAGSEQRLKLTLN